MARLRPVSPATACQIRRRTTAPMMAAIQVLQSKNSSIGSPKPIACAMNPAMSAPATPTSVVTMIPPGCSPGRSALAMRPARRPSTIQPMMPTVHLPVVSRPVCPLTRKLKPEDPRASAEAALRETVLEDLLEARLVPGSQRRLHPDERPATVELERADVVLEGG